MNPFRPFFKRDQRAVTFLIKTISSSIITFSLAHTCFSILGYPARVQGISMSPSLNQKNSHSNNYWFKKHNDWVFVNCWSTKSKDFERGEIVIFNSPRNPNDIVIKRIIALQGDTILIEGREPIQIERGYCWVEGDNSFHSVDSTKYGQIPLGLIFGKATKVIWPPNRLRSLSVEIPHFKGIDATENNFGTYTLFKSNIILG